MKTCRLSVKNTERAKIHITPNGTLLWLPLFFVLMFLTSFLHADEVTINARSLEYDQDSKYLVAQGSVTVTWQDKMLNADEIEFWTDKEFLIAKGTVTLIDSNNTIFCRDMTYDYKSHTAEANKVFGSFTPWFFATKTMEKKNESKYETKAMRMTTCDNPRPHYTIHASSAKITVGKRITIYNAIFFVRSVPLFYLPIFSQPIGGGRYTHSLDVEPGYNSTDGVMLKSTYGFQVNKYSYAKLYLDYYELRGWGEGGEYDYNTDKLRGSIYVYNIKDESTGIENFNLKISHWQKLDAYWTSRSNINYVNSTTFGSQYLQDNWALFQRQIDSSLAFTRQTKKSNLTLSVNRTDATNASTGEFETTSMMLPQVSYTRFSLLNKSPYNSTLNMTFQNSYNKANDYYDESAYTRIDIKRSYTIDTTFRRLITIGIVHCGMVFFRYKPRSSKFCKIFQPPDGFA